MIDPQKPTDADLPQEPGRTPEQQAQVERELDLSDAQPTMHIQPRGEQAPHLGQAPAGRAPSLPQEPGVKGAVPPPERTQSEGTEQGMRSPGFESIQSAGDVAGAMVNYQAQLVSTLTTITRVLMDTTSKLEQLENYLDRLRS